MRSLLLDTNVLLLFLVGNKYPDKIGTKRLKEFDEDDLRRVNRYCGSITRHITLPNILTETSNHLGSGKQELVPGGSELLKGYCRLAEECYLPSRGIADHLDFPRLGLTDAAIVSLVDGNVTVLTGDYELCGRLTAKGVEAVNIFNAKTRY